MVKKTGKSQVIFRDQENISLVCDRTEGCFGSKGLSLRVHKLGLDRSILPKHLAIGSSEGNVNLQEELSVTLDSAVQNRAWFGSVRRLSENVLVGGSLKSARESCEQTHRSHSHRRKSEFAGWDSTMAAPPEITLEDLNGYWVMVSVHCRLMVIPWP